MSVAIGIAHAEWDHRRTAPLQRLMQQLDAVDGVNHVHVSCSPWREHAREWAPRLWAWGARQDASHIVFLNDDIRVCPEFVDACDAIASVLPNDVICMHTTLPEAAQLPIPFFRSYWVTGPAYMIPRHRLQDLLVFAHEWSGLWESENEDGVAMQWLWHNQTPACHTVPALVVHDVEVPSTLGYDHHPLRRASVPWHSRPEIDVSRPGWWGSHFGGPLAECPWRSVEAFKSIEMRRGRPPICAFCATRRPVVQSVTGAGMCRDCLVECAKKALGVSVHA